MINSTFSGLFAVLFACFVIFIVIVFKGFRDSFAEGKKSSPAVRFGVIAQSLSYAIAWLLRRQRVNPFGGPALWPDLLIAAVSLALAVGAVALAVAAKKRLGKQWALAARLIEGHRLVTDGPFGRVRHPLYLAMGLLLLAAVLGLSSGLGAEVALPFFVVGTSLRVRAEERLLRAAFGRDFDDYRKRVPALFPRLRPGRNRPDHAESIGLN